MMSAKITSVAEHGAGGAVGVDMEVHVHVGRRDGTRTWVRVWTAVRLAMAASVCLCTGGAMVTPGLKKGVVANKLYQ